MDNSSGMKQLLARFKNLGGIPLVATVMSLSMITRFYAGDLGVDKFNYARWLGIGTIVLLFFLTSFLVDLVDSLLKVKRFVNQETRNVNVAELWRETYTNPLAGMVVVFIMAIGVANAQDLSEVYRNSVSHWHDAELWQLESGCFKVLKGSLLDYPSFWDGVYFSLWGFIMLVYSIIYKAGKFHHFGVFSISTVVSFFITRWSALKYATAGPVFYQPEFFDISGTVSSKTQEMLLLYMSGGLVQNGFIPGTMGMPSLHVGLAIMAVWFLACHARWTLWFSVPWLCLIWLSTIMLGWHYILDGLGGVAVAAVSMTIVHGLLQVMRGSGGTIKAGLEDWV
jgi:hypothetical protein